MKKMHAILLTAAACLLLTACDGEAEQTTVAITTTEPSAATEETTDPSETEKLTAAEAAQASYETEEALSDEELEQCLLVWEEVRNALSDWQTSANERGLTLEEKKTEAYDLLTDLARTGTENAPYSLIAEHTIKLDNSTPARFYFSYTCGGSGAIMLEPFPEGLN